MTLVDDAYNKLLARIEERRVKRMLDKVENKEITKEEAKKELTTKEWVLFEMAYKE